MDQLSLFDDDDDEDLASACRSHYIDQFDAEPWNDSAEDREIALRAIRRSHAKAGGIVVLSAERLATEVPTIRARTIDGDGRRRMCAVHQWIDELTVISQDGSKRRVPIGDGWRVVWL